MPKRYCMWMDTDFMGNQLWNKSKHFYLFLILMLKKLFFKCKVKSLYNFYKHIFRSSRLQMFFKINALKNFAIPRVKFIKLAGWRLAYNFKRKKLKKFKKTSTQVCFSMKFAKFLRTLFFYRTPPVTASAFFLKSKHYFETLLWRTNIFSCRHIVWCIKSRTRLFINLSSIVRL